MENVFGTKATNRARVKELWQKIRKEVEVSASDAAELTGCFIDGRLISDEKYLVWISRKNPSNRRVWDIVE